MKLTINGKDRDFFAPTLTVAQLLAELAMKQDRVALELNREIVPKAKWDATMLSDGDRLEIVHFVRGGSH